MTSEELMLTKILIDLGHIDPGHGSYDGITKIYRTCKDFLWKDDMSEFDMTYKILEHLKQALENNPRFDVRITKKPK